MTLTGSATLPLVFALAAVGGLVLVFDAPGRQTLTFQMVGPKELQNAVALNSGLFNGSRVIGPAIAGVVIALVGTGLCFVVNAVSFLSVLVSLRLMREEELHPVEKRPETRVLAGIREGFAWAYNAPVARVVLSVITVVSLVGFNFHVLVPLLASQTLDVGAETFGILASAFGLGALVGALAIASLREATTRVFVGGAAGFSALMLTLSLIDSVALALVLLFGLGASFALFTSSANALVQLSAPESPARARDEPLPLRVRRPGARRAGSSRAGSPTSAAHRSPSGSQAQRGSSRSPGRRGSCGSAASCRPDGQHRNVEVGIARPGCRGGGGFTSVRCRSVNRNAERSPCEISELLDARRARAARPAASSRGVAGSAGSSSARLAARGGARRRPSRSGRVTLRSNITDHARTWRSSSTRVRRVSSSA